MRKYYSFFRMRFINGLQYRIAAYAGISTQFAWGFMAILIFAAFYKANPHAFPMTFSQLSSYIWLQQAFLALYMTWLFDNDIFDAISNGSVAYELCRPMDIYNMWFAKNIASRLSSAALRCMPVLIITAFLPKPYNLGLPNNLTDFSFFVISMSLGFLLVVAFCMLIYIMTFYTISPMGVRFVAMSMMELLTGAVIPLPFFPDKIRWFVELLPFAYMQNIPLRIYSGSISGSDAIYDICLQLFWLIVLVVCGKVWMKKALKQVVLQGG